MRIIFAGTPDFAVPSLRALINADVEVIAAYSQPDRRSGRGRKVSASAVKRCALDNNIEVLQPVRFDQPAIDELVRLKADLAVVAAYGLLLPTAVLQAPRLGCVNVHASLLPRWRGAAPIARAIEHGDTHSGITLMQMDEGLDTGDILCQSAIELTPREDALSLHDRLAELGGALLSDKLPAIADQTMTRQPQQDADTCYASKLKKAEADIDWTQSAEVVDRKVRALTGWPVASSTFNGEIWKVWAASPIPEPSPGAGRILRLEADGIVVGCGHNCLRLTRLQRPGGKQLQCSDFLRGLRDQAPSIGDQFNVTPSAIGDDAASTTNGTS